MISETKMRWENENCEGKRREERLNLKEGCVVLCCVSLFQFTKETKKQPIEKGELLCAKVIALEVETAASIPPKHE